MKWNKWWTAGLALILVVGGGGGYWWWSQQQGQKPLQAALQTTPVRKGNLESAISGTGNIETAYRETLKSSSSGKIATVSAKQGDKVKQGQVLATFEQDDTSTSRETQIRSKQLDLKKRQLDLESLQKQFKEASDDDRRAELAITIQKQQLDIESVKEDIVSLQEESDDVLDPIIAPIDGTLTSFTLAVGDTIGGQSGINASSLGEVVDYEQLQIVVGVDELDISKVKLGQHANILVEALPDQTFTGKVTDIAQEGTATSGVATFDVTIMLDDVTNLRAGMSAEATIIVEQKADALYLPIEAVQSIGNRYFVMVPGTPAGGETESSGGGTGTPDGDAAIPGRGTGTPGGDAAIPGGGTGFSGRGTAVGGSNRQSRMAAAGLQDGVQRVAIEVGIHNEDFIEIVSGLQEGQAVVVPMTASGSANSNTFGAGGFGGGGFGGGGFAPGETVRVQGGGGFGPGGSGGANRGAGGAANRSAGGAQGGGAR